MNCAFQTKYDATKIAMEKDSEIFPPTLSLSFQHLPGDLGEPAAAAGRESSSLPRRMHETKQGRSGCGGQVRRAKGFAGFYMRFWIIILKVRRYAVAIRLFEKLSL